MIYSIFGKKFRSKLKEAFSCYNNLTSSNASQLNNPPLQSINQSNITHLNNNTSNYSNGTSNSISNQLILVTPNDLPNNLTDDLNQFSNKKIKNDLINKETFV